MSIPKKIKFPSLFMRATAYFTVLFLIDSTSQAALITNIVELDLNLTTIVDAQVVGQPSGTSGQSIYGSFPLVAITPFTPQVGDVLQTEITFARGDRLRITNGPVNPVFLGPDYPESLFFYFFKSGVAAGNTSSTMTTDVEFFGLQGTLSDPTPGGESSLLLSQKIGDNFTSDWISFTGLRLTSTVNVLPASVPEFDQFGLFTGRAGGFEILPATVNAVPEPASLTLYGLGSLGGFSSFRRKFVRQSQAQ